MRVEVTEEDIRNGIPGSSTSCAVALAIRRADGGRVPIVFMHRVNHRGNSVILPSHVVEFIKRFDDEQFVEPFEFELGSV